MRCLTQSSSRLQLDCRWITCLPTWAFIGAARAKYMKQGVPCHPQAGALSSSGVRTAKVRVSSSGHIPEGSSSLHIEARHHITAPLLVAHWVCNSQQRWVCSHRGYGGASHDTDDTLRPAFVLHHHGEIPSRGPICGPLELRSLGALQVCDPRLAA